MLGGAGCQTTGPTVISSELPFDQAVTDATDGLVAQTQKLPAFLAKVEATVGAKVAKKAVLIDPMIDAASGQQTRVTRQLEQKVAERLTTTAPAVRGAAVPEREPGQGAVPADRHDDAQRRQRGAPAVSDQPRAGRPEPRAAVAAQASALARDDGLDASPTAYYQDSPVLLKDQVVDGYIRTAQTAPGPARRRLLPRAPGRVGADQRRQQRLQRQPVPGCAGPVPQRVVHARGRTVAGSQRRVPGELEARPHRRRRAGLRPRGRVRLAAAQPRREVPVQPRQHRVLVGPEGQRPVCDLVAPDRAPDRLGQGLHERGRPHQPHRQRNRPTTACRRRARR